MELVAEKQTPLIAEIFRERSSCRQMVDCRKNRMPAAYPNPLLTRQKEMVPRVF